MNKYNDFVEKYKFWAVLIFMILLTFIVVFISNIKIEDDYKKLKNVDKTPKLALEEPVYINGNSDLKYSQIKIQNISDEPLYDIFIRLQTQKTTEKSKFLSKAYTLSYLKSGETAILITEHPNVSGDETLKVDEIYYMDDEGNYLRRKEFSDTSDKTFSNMVLESHSENKFRVLSNKENLLKIEDENYKKISDGLEFSAKIKNISDLDLKYTYITFIKYEDEIVVGQEDISLENLTAGQEKLINIKLKLNNNLKLFRYGYTVDNFETKTEDSYEIYAEEKAYRVDSRILQKEIERKNLIKFYKQTIVSIVLLVIDYIQKKLTKKAKIEGIDRYLEYIKRINLVKWVAILGLVINIIFS